MGVAAGFDKNMLYVEVLHALGFAAIEVGTVTLEVKRVILNPVGVAKKIKH